MQSKPELLVFSIYLMGGGASFHRNMIDNRPDNFFDIKCIYLNPLHWHAKRSDDVALDENNIVFEFSEEPSNEVSSRLEKLISEKEGVVITNFDTELATLNTYKRKKKTIFFICQDDAYIYLAKKYNFIIDVIITHNITVYEEICGLLPNRKKDIHFIPHGVIVQHFERNHNLNNKLRLVFLARHVKLKGIYDLPKIDDELKKRNIEVEWIIFGDGEEKQNFIKEVKSKDNFKFLLPKTTEDVIEALKMTDVYVLPSSLDGLPVSLLESMSVGCVPIVYNFSEGIKSVITSDIGFVVEKGDVISVADKIEFLSKNRNELKKRSIACSKKIFQEYDIKKQSNHYFSLYKNYKKLKKLRYLKLKNNVKKYFNFKFVRIFYHFVNKQL
ncbi:glycosyltransferase family 4 protein [Flavobacterium sp. WC2430]|uniref:glycosyltransferase family 4 protein n=1 Tax=Flavobacterium sp. WC2430 TaxID=3234137 RepID=UPI00346563D8